MKLGNNITTLFFDLDGTLTNPGEGIVNSVMYALKKFGIDESNRKKLFSFIGPPLVDSFKEHYGMNIDEAITAVEYYREYFTDKGINENELYEGVDDCLSYLKSRNYVLAVVTSKPQPFAERVLENFGIDKFFDYVVGADMDERIPSSKPDIIRNALKITKEKNPSSIVMIGDRKFDVQGAKEFSLLSVGVCYGYGSREELENAKADFTVNTVEELKDLF